MSNTISGTGSVTNYTIMLPTNVPSGDAAGWSGSYQCPIDNNVPGTLSYADDSKSISTRSAYTTSSISTVQFTQVPGQVHHTGTIFFNSSSANPSTPASSSSTTLSTSANDLGPTPTIAEAAMDVAKAFRTNGDFNLLETFFR